MDMDRKVIFNRSCRSLVGGVALGDVHAASVTKTGNPMLRLSRYRQTALPYPSSPSRSISLQRRHQQIPRRANCGPGWTKRPLRPSPRRRAGVSIGRASWWYPFWATRNRWLASWARFGRAVNSTITSPNMWLSRVLRTSRNCLSPTSPPTWLRRVIQPCRLIRAIDCAGLGGWTCCWMIDRADLSERNQHHSGFTTISMYPEVVGRRA